MSKKREDNRDIFDKALDYAPLIGTIAGGAIGARIGVGKARKLIAKGQHDAVAIPAMTSRVAAGAVAGNVAGNVAAKNNKSRRK